MTQQHNLPSSDSAVAVGVYHVGIDVAKDKLDLARSDTQQVLCVSNDPVGFTRVLRALANPAPAIIVVESTGGLERPLIDALLDAGLPVALVNPKQVRYFAKGLGILAKTDAIDAAVLARFAALASPRLCEKRSANQADIDALISCRRQLITTRTAQTNRRGATSNKTALKALDDVIKTLDKQIQRLDQQIKKLIESDDDLNAKSKLLQSVPGVGGVLSASLVAELSELGTTEHRRISALVGVAPFANDSGPHRGKRSIRGGRRDLRCNLYMATMAAMRFNPVIKPFAQRLAKAGKIPKVVIVACMRKLITLLNAMLRDGLRWNQLRVVQTALGGGAK
jgi:transposase